MNRVVAFLPGNATSATRGLDIGTIPGDRITDLIYSFAGFTQQRSSWVPTSSDNGATFGGQFIPNETSDAVPALASEGSQVPIAWKGHGNYTLNVAQLACF